MSAQETISLIQADIAAFSPSTPMAEARTLAVTIYEHLEYEDLLADTDTTDTRHEVKIMTPTDHLGDEYTPSWEAARAKLAAAPATPTPVVHRSQVNTLLAAAAIVRESSDAGCTRIETAGRWFTATHLEMLATRIAMDADDTNTTPDAHELPGMWEPADYIDTSEPEPVKAPEYEPDAEHLAAHNAAEAARLQRNLDDDLMPPSQYSGLDRSFDAYYGTGES